MRRLLVVATVTALLAPGVATAARRPMPVHVVPHDVLGDAVHRLREAARRRDVAAARHAYADTVVAALGGDVRAGSFEQWDVRAWPVGDVDGDRAPDVVEITRSYDIGTANNDPAAASEVRLRRGRDGRVAWEVDVAGFAGARPIRLGPDGAPGVLVVAGDWQHALDAGATYAASVTTSVTAYDDQGAQRWTRSYEGRLYQSLAGWVEATFPYVMKVYDAVLGVADDVLIAQATFGYPVTADVLAVHTIDGTSGTPTATYAVEAAVDGFVSGTATPDLDGDGLGDVVLASGARAGRGRATAYRANDGREVWANRDLPIGPSPAQVPVGDVDGDRVTDIAMPSSAGTVPVVSGRDGRLLWSAPVPAPAADDHDLAVFALRDVDRDRRADVAVVVTSQLFQDKAYVIAVTTSGHGGRVIYRRTETIRLPEGIGASLHGEVADVQGDGVADLQFTVGAARYSWTGKPAAAGRVIDGRTGRVLHRRPVGITTMTSLDGRGTDFLEVTSPSRNLLQITAYDGATARQLWRTWWRPPTPLGSAFAWSEGRLTADRCGDVVVGVGFDREATAALLVLGGRDGRLLWGRSIVDGTERRLAGLSYGADDNRAC